MGDEGDDLAAVDAFALLSDATRLGILRELHRADAPVAFSALYDRVDTDDTAKFNYHLGELRPHFVAKGEDGYALTAAGRRLARAVVAGRYTDSPTVEPFPVEGDCYACGEAALAASYADEVFAVECRDCGEPVLRVRVPPTVVRERAGEDLVDAFETWSRYQVEQALAGVCPDCGGPVEPGVRTDLNEAVAVEAAAVLACRICGREATTSFGAVAARDPDVRRFLRERDASLRDRRLWTVDQFVIEDHVSVRSRDPWLVEVTFHADGDACRAEVDGDLEVVRTEVVADAESEGD